MVSSKYDTDVLGTTAAVNGSGSGALTVVGEPTMDDLGEREDEAACVALCLVAARCLELDLTSLASTVCTEEATTGAATRNESFSRDGLTDITACGTTPDAFLSEKSDESLLDEWFDTGGGQGALWRLTSAC